MLGRDQGLDHVDAPVFAPLARILSALDDLLFFQRPERLAKPARAVPDAVVLEEHFDQLLLPSGCKVTDAVTLVAALQAREQAQNPFVEQR
jgi:hypothetical protein